MEGLPQVKRTSKLLTMEGAARLLEDRESVRAMKQQPRFLEEIPGYQEKVALYEYWLKLHEESHDTERKPFLFFHHDTAIRKAEDINRRYGKEVATLSFGKREGHDSYRLKLDVSAIKETFKEILNEHGSLLASQQGLAA